MGNKNKVMIGLSIFLLIIIVLIGYLLFNVTKENKEIKLENEQLKKNSYLVEKNESKGTTTENLENAKKNEVKENKDEQRLTVELAYGILNKYKNERLSTVEWYIKNVKVVGYNEADNSYLVSYVERNYSDYRKTSNYYDTPLEAIVEYKNGVWTTDLPGVSGMSIEERNQYKPINVKENEDEQRLTVELAYGILNKYKNEKLPDVEWDIVNVSIVGYNEADNSYLVRYVERNYSDYSKTPNYYDALLEAIVEYKNGVWTTDLPGVSGMSIEERNQYKPID